MRNLSLYAGLRKQALRVLRNEEETLTHLKAQLGYLIQKYIFVMFSKKLGFKLVHPPCDNKLQIDGNFAYSQAFKDLVVVAIKEFQEANQCSYHRVVRLLSNRLNVKRSLLYAWIYEAVPAMV